MTARELLHSETARLVAYAVLVGIAYATLRAEVAQKADRAEVATAIAMTTAAAASRAETIALDQSRMARDIRDIKAILCASTKARSDSYCLDRP